MDASGAAQAFDAQPEEGLGRSAPVLRFVAGGSPKPESRPSEALKPASLEAEPSQSDFSQAPEAQSGRYGAGRRVNWGAIGAIAGLHVALLAALVTMDVVKLTPLAPEPIMVDLVQAAPPPPPPAPMPEASLEPVTPIVAPPVLDILPPQPSPVQAAAEPAPAVMAPAVVAQPKAAPAAGPGIETVEDLSATMIEAKPPRYPLESRRRKEEGTVVLLLTVGPDGAVADIRVSRSSGFERLDKAALEAVRKWRWSPTLRNGVAVPVRGFVEIPFVLKK